MKRQPKTLLVLLFILSCITIISCRGDDYGFAELKLTKEDKVVLNELVKKLNSNPKQTILLLSHFVKANPTSHEIPKAEADALFKEYVDHRRSILQPHLINRWNDPQFKEISSIVFSADSIFNFILRTFELGKDIGIRMVYGGYDRDTTLHNRSAGLINEKYSGKMTLFFLATERVDTIINGTRTHYWRDLIKPNKTIESFGIYNHGELCPDICEGTDYK
jgi:hypothetical protein